MSDGARAVELDLTEAIEAAAGAIDAERDIDFNVNRLAEAAVRAAAPIIERAVRERVRTDIIDKVDHLRTRKPKLASGGSRVGGLEEAAWIARNGPDEFVRAAGEQAAPDA